MASLCQSRFAASSWSSHWQFDAAAFPMSPKKRLKTSFMPIIHLMIVFETFVQQTSMVGRFEGGGGGEDHELRRATPRNSVFIVMKQDLELNSWLCFPSRGCGSCWPLQCVVLRLRKKSLGAEKLTSAKLLQGSDLSFWR